VSETGEIVFALCLLIVVYVLTRKFHMWRIKNTYMSIIKDLENKKALDPPSAVELPYSQTPLWRLGTRDYRPKALQYLISSRVVGMTDSGKYYLKNRNVNLADAG
jgi:hypothetical protein